MSTDETHHEGDATHEAPTAHDDGHGHGGMALGPVDVRMWATGLLGVVLGLLGAAVFAISTGRL